MTTYQILLDDDTVITATTDMAEDAIIGTSVTGTVQDENGNPIERTGIAIEVLSSQE